MRILHTVFRSLHFYYLHASPRLVSCIKYLSAKQYYTNYRYLKTRKFTDYNVSSFT